MPSMSETIVKQKQRVVRHLKQSFFNCLVDLTHAACLLKKSV
jgi:hypothetical protein